MRILQDLFKSNTFRVVVTDDADCVEICSTLRVSTYNCPSISLYIYISICSHISISIHPRITIFLSLYLYIYISTYLSISFKHSIYIYIHIYIYISISHLTQNIIAFGAGLADGMELNENTKAGVIRRGFLETLQFVDVFYPGSRLATFFESCGLSDLVTSCYGTQFLTDHEIIVYILFFSQPIAIASWPRPLSRLASR